MTPITIDGVTYSLSGDFTDLVEAERFFGERVADVNLAKAIANVVDQASALQAVRQIFPCTLRRHHPDVTWDDAQSMIDRAIVSDDTSIIGAVWKHIWPPMTDETRTANRSLTFELDALAEANEVFKGEPGLLLLFAEPPRLEQVWRVFPCALHRSRPDLDVGQLRALMTLESVKAVMVLLGLMETTVAQEKMSAFCERVYASSLERDRTEFVFRIISRQQWPGAAQA